MPDPKVQHAFVSYVREDADEVSRLVSVLQGASIPVWKDTDRLWPGEDWQQKIREAIEDGSLAFIACFSTNSVQKAKTYMNAELRLAVDQIRLMKPGQVWLLPVRLDDCELPNFDLGNNRNLNSLQRIDLFGPDREANLGRLISAVMKIFGTSTTAASTAAAIADSASSERGPLLAEALKARIGDPGKQMELEDLFLNEVRTVTRELRGDARFPASGGSGPTITTLVKRAREYEGLVEPLTHAAITLGAWGGEPDAAMVTRAMKSLAATTQDVRGGFTAYISLRTYPLLLLLYAGALGAVARSSGRMLAAFTTDPTVAVEGRAFALPVAITPWRPFAEAEDVASVLARIALEGGTVEQYATDAAQRRGPRYYTPLSEYLFARLRPIAERFVLDESEYEQLFHRTEALIALAELDWMAGNIDTVNAHRRAWSRWMGRGIHRTNYYLTNNVTLGNDLLGEIQSKQEAWWPVAGGMFGGDWTRAETAANEYITYEAEERKRRW